MKLVDLPMVTANEPRMFSVNPLHIIFVETAGSEQSTIAMIESKHASTMKVGLSYDDCVAKINEALAG